MKHNGVLLMVVGAGLALAGLGRAQIAVSSQVRFLQRQPA